MSRPAKRQKRSQMPTRVPSKHIIGNSIKERRLQKGYLNVELAKELDVHPSTITYWERGQMGVSDHYKIKLCRILGCSITELFDWGDK